MNSSEKQQSYINLFSVFHSCAVLKGFKWFMTINEWVAYVIIITN